METLTFWRQAIERAIKTFAQTAVALLTADHVVGLLSADWQDVGSVAGLAALVSILTSVGSAPLGPDGTSPSVVSTRWTRRAR